MHFELYYVRSLSEPVTWYSRFARPERHHKRHRHAPWYPLHKKHPKLRDTSLKASTRINTSLQTSTHIEKHALIHTSRKHPPHYSTHASKPRHISEHRYRKLHAGKSRKECMYRSNICRNIFKVLCAIDLIPAHGHRQPEHSPESEKVIYNLAAIHN